MAAPGGTAEALSPRGSPTDHVRRRSSGGSAVMRRVSSLGSYKGSPVKISRLYGGAVHRLSDNTLLGSSISQTAPLGKEAFKKAAKDVTDGCRVRSPLDADWLVDATISDVANFHFSWSIGDDLVFIVGVDRTYPDTVGQQALQDFKRQFADAVASKGKKADIKKLVKTIVVALSDIYDNPDLVDQGDVGMKQLDLATPTSAMTVADVELTTPVSRNAATPKIVTLMQPQARPSPPRDTATQQRKQQHQQEQLKGSVSTQQQQQQQQPRRDSTTQLQLQQPQQQQRKGITSHDRQHTSKPPLPPTPPPPPPPPPPPQQLESMMRTVQLAPPDSKLPAEATTQQAAQEFRVNVTEVQRRAASQRHKYATILLSGIGTFVLGLSLPVIVYYVKGDLNLPVQT